MAPKVWLSRRGDRVAVAGLLAVVVVAIAVSVVVDHRRDGGPVVPGVALASQTGPSSRPTGQQTGGAEPPAALAGSSGDGAIGGDAGGGGEAPLGFPAPGLPPFTDGPGDGPTDQPPGSDEGTLIPVPPPPQVDAIELPPEVRPLSQLAAPVSFEACQYLGIIPLVFALGAVAGALPIPASDLLPYMKPLFDLCLVVGVPETDTTCQFDKQIDDGANVPEIPAVLGLTVGEVIEAIPLPTPIGLLIDELEALERLVLGPPPRGDDSRFSDRLTEALVCSQR